MPEAMHTSPGNMHETPGAGLRLVNAGPYEAPRGKDFPPHRDGSWELIYYRAGSIDSVVGDRVFPGRPGVVLTIPPRLLHAERARTAYANFFIQIDAPERQPWPPLCYDDEHGTFGHICGTLVREWHGRAIGREAMVESLLGQLDILLRRAHEQAQVAPTERLVREAERLLAERAGSPLRITHVAGEIGVSPSFLRAQFVRLRGRTPSDFLRELRVQHALALIRNSSAPLEAIAGTCGYDSASHLSRHVKRVTGQSPGALRSR